MKAELWVYVSLAVLLAGASICPAVALEGPEVNPANGHTYYLLDAADWTESEEVATGMDGHLTTIDDVAEDAWVFDTFSAGTGRNLWIGLNDAAVEDSFVWVSGDPVVYTNWDPGEPNNLQDEDYVMIIGQEGPEMNGKWNDLHDWGREGWTVPFGVVEIPYRIVGDLNADGWVGQIDLSIVLTYWGSNVTAGDRLSGDPSGDGFVGQFDLDCVLADWGVGTLPTSPVPEPATLMLLALAAPAILRRHGRG